MTRFNRRTYLKGALMTAGTLVIGDVAGATATPGEDAQEQLDDYPCPSGTSQLAHYKVTDGTLKHVAGEDVLTVSNVQTTDDGYIQAFDWESTAIVATVEVKIGSTVERYEGGYSGYVDASGKSGVIEMVTLCAPRGGRAVLCELDMDTGQGAYDTEFHVVGDPAADNSSDGRQGVVQVTSDGDKTRDYAHSMITVVERLGARIPLSSFSTIRFDYFEGTNNTGAIPDEVFVSFLTPKDELKLAYYHVNAGGPSHTWRTFDVLQAIKNNQWDVVDVTLDSLHTSEGAIQVARNLRDSPDRTVDLLSAYGDATLTGVGFGAGNTREETTIDRYFDNLYLEWDGQNALLDFPATVPLSVIETDRRGRGLLVVKMQFQQDEQGGLTYEEVIPESVKLNPLASFAPPIEDGLNAQQVRVTDNALEARFNAQQVGKLLDDQQVFIVSGDFHVPTGSSFIALGLREGDGAGRGGDGGQGQDGNQ